MLRLLTFFACVSYVATPWFALAQKPPIRLVAQAGHARGTMDIAVDPLGNRIASISMDGNIRVWDARTGRLVADFGRDNGISVNCTISISRDGNRVLATSMGVVREWDARTGHSTRTIPSPGALRAEYQTNGDIVIVESSRTLVLDSQTLRTRQILSYPALTLGPLIGAFSSKSWMALDGYGTLADLAYKGRRVSSLQLTELDFIEADFSANGSQLIIGIKRDGPGSVGIYDARTGKLIRDLGSHRVGNVALSGDGQFAVLTDGSETVKVWTRTGAARSIAFESRISLVRAGIGSQFAFSSDSGAVGLFDVAQPGPPPAGILASAQSINVSSASVDGRKLVVGSQQGFVSVWELLDPRLNRMFDARLGSKNVGVEIRAVALSPDGAEIASSSLVSGINLWDATTGVLRRAIPGLKGAGPVAYSADGSKLALSANSSTSDKVNHVSVVEASSGRTLRTISVPGESTYVVKLDNSGKRLATGGADDVVRVWNLEMADLPPVLLNGHRDSVYALDFSPDRLRLASASADGYVCLWDIASGRAEHRLFVGSAAISVCFSPDGARIFASSTLGAVFGWEAASGRLLFERKPARWIGRIEPLGPYAAFVGSGGSAGSTIFDMGDGHEMGSLFSFSDGSWAIVAPDGRFDVSSLEGSPLLHWIVPDSPLTPEPIEAFTRDYYEPGLLAKLLRRERMPSLRSIAELNRIPPYLRIAVTEIGANEASLEVFASRKVRGIREALPQDLRLFVDGKLVAYEDGHLELDPQGRWTKSYRVRLPQNGGKEIEVSAYCFNQDRVKSETVRRTLKINLAKKIGKAYVISAGVEHYDRAGMDLQFAADDAITLSEALEARLAGYSEVVTVPLLSDGSFHNATKAKFRAVLETLAGRPADLSGVPNGERLAKSTPEDLVVISWSGHGISSTGGNFYLLPEDVKNDSDTLGKEFLSSCISTDELTSWLRDVQAADMAFIVDACHSAAAVQSEEFKPAPLGNRGLGQLAYDKGIRILAATQAENVALESGALGNGLLTYALVHDGLSAGKSPTLKEWLSYAVERVPQIYQELKKGTLKLAQGARSSNAGASGNDPSLQRPALFDFTRRPSPVPFVKV